MVDLLNRPNLEHPAVELDAWVRLDRFLILGSESGTYGVTGSRLNAETATSVQVCLKSDGSRVVERVTRISSAAQAPKSAPALFALAMAASPQYADAATVRAALAALPLVARTGRDLCEFAAFVQNLRGWGRGLRSAIADWYLARPVKDLAQEILKQTEQTGWSHRDLLRIAHPKPATPEQNALFQWAVEGEIGHLAPADLPIGNLRQVYAAEQARKAHEEHEVVRFIEEFGLTHEMISREWKDSASVWEALLHGMPYSVLVEQLGKMTQVGLLEPMAPATALAITRLTDARRVRHAGVHPVSVLSALQEYKEGRSHDGTLEWTPVANIINALEEAFYLAFDNIEPSGKRIYLAIDASTSMPAVPVNGVPRMDAATAAAAIAMMFVRSERDVVVTGFHDRIWHANISKRDRLAGVCDAIEREDRGTNASLPMKDALQRDLPVDAFVIVTDSKTWPEEHHPVQGLLEYRRRTGIPAKLVVIAAAAKRHNITSSDDPLQLGVSGFDETVPAVVSGFITAIS